jgi:hypothetical protein
MAHPSAREELKTLTPVLVQDWSFPVLACRPMGIDPTPDDLGSCPGWICCLMSIFQALFQLCPDIAAQIKLETSILLAWALEEKQPPRMSSLA